MDSRTKKERVSGEVICTPKVVTSACLRLFAVEPWRMRTILFSPSDGPFFPQVHCLPDLESPAYGEVEWEPPLWAWN